MKTQVVALAVVMVLVVSFMHVHAWCTEGQTGSNGCNTCTCFNTMVICTRRQCGQGKRLGWCEGASGSFWMDNCHQCTCYRGKYQCVLKPDCVTGKKKYPNCKGESLFLYECNNCRCGSNATHPACTKKGCPSQFQKMVLM
uniref:Protease inhibitor n=1 Tax=Scylla olivacea TaxID=85551 RepID=A0A0N7ZC40_SCYOL